MPSRSRGSARAGGTRLRPSAPAHPDGVPWARGRPAERSAVQAADCAAKLRRAGAEHNRHVDTAADAEIGPRPAPTRALRQAEAKHRAVRRCPADQGTRGTRRASPRRQPLSRRSRPRPRTLPRRERPGLRSRPRPQDCREEGCRRRAPSDPWHRRCRRPSVTPRIRPASCTVASALCDTTSIIGSPRDRENDAVTWLQQDRRIARRIEDSSMSCRSYSSRWAVGSRDAGLRAPDRDGAAGDPEDGDLARGVAMRRSMPPR